jgi:DNA-directed RNA polymerase subunit RPC12/RpoP
MMFTSSEAQLSLHRFLRGTEDITVQCPKCGHVYQDRFRGSVNLALDDFDEEDLDQCSSATCPECQHKVSLDVLVVEDGVFKFEAQN